MEFKSINPTNNQLMGSFPIIDTLELELVIENSNIAFQKWRDTSVDQKKQLLKALATEILIYIEDCSRIITDEMGKPLKESMAEMKKCADLCLYYADNFETYLQPKVLSDKAIIYYEPLGVIFGISPWNFPFWQVFRFAIPTLLAGNTVIVKHAPNTPQCAIQLVMLFKKAGFPKNVFQSVFIDISQVESFVSSKIVQGVSLTGSTAAGRSVAILAAKYLKKCVLELGGNDAFVVTRNANIERAVEKAVLARCRNNGQSCVAAKRFIIDAVVYDFFKSKLVEALKSLKIGDPKLADSTNGPLARRDLYDNVLRQTAILEQKHFTKTFELEDNTGLPNVIAPAIWEGGEHFDEEIFAPIFLLHKTTDIDQMIELVNHSNYGLGCSIWSDNAIDAQQLSSRIVCGMIYINELVYSSPSLPFGGIKQSGIGKELGEEGIKEFTTHKLIFTK